MVSIGQKQSFFFSMPSTEQLFTDVCYAIFTGSGAGTPPPVHTATALTRRQSTWSYIVQLMSRPEGTSGREDSSTRTHDASGTSWNGLGRWPAPWPGMRERELGRVYKPEWHATCSACCTSSVLLYDWPWTHHISVRPHHITASRPSLAPHPPTSSHYKLTYFAYVGVSSMEVKTEADSHDITECTHDDKPTIGMFGYSLQSHISCSFSCLHLSVVLSAYIIWVSSYQ